jgi:hypothetical protein
MTLGGLLLVALIVAVVVIGNKVKENSRKIDQLEDKKPKD